MHGSTKKLTRFLVLGLLFLLPRERKIRIDQHRFVTPAEQRTKELLPIPCERREFPSAWVY